MGDIGQMVAETLDIGNEIDENTAAFGLAQTLIKAFDMPVDKAFAVGVDFLFHAVHFGKQSLVRIQHGLFGKVVKRVDIFDHIAYFLNHAVGKFHIFFYFAAGILGEIVGNIGNTHDVAHAIVQRRNLFLFLLSAICGHFNHIIYQILTEIGCFFDFGENCGRLAHIARFKRVI